MKRVYTLLLLLLTLCGINCMAATKGYTVTGQVSGIPNGTVLQFFPMGHGSFNPVGETVVKNGKFTFNGEASEPRGLIMIVKNNYGSLYFMVNDGENIKISGKAPSTEARDGKRQYSLSNLTVTGSPTTDKFNAFMAPRRETDRKMNAARAKYKHIMDILNTDGAPRERIDSVMKSSDFKALQEEEREIFKNNGVNFRKMIEDNRDSFWAPLLMISNMAYLTANERPMYESLSDAAKNSYYGKLVHDEIYPLGKPGDAVPAFAGKLSDGTATSLAELCKGKKYVLIDFWASWCKPCRKEIPNIKAIYDKHKANGFDIVSVSIDENENAWLKAVEKEELVWPNLRDTDKSIAQKYHVSSVPTMYIVDGQGRLVGENLRGEALTKKIDELMAQ